MLSSNVLKTAGDLTEQRTDSCGRSNLITFEAMGLTLVDQRVPFKRGAYQGVSQKEIEGTGVDVCCHKLKKLLEE